MKRLCSTTREDDCYCYPDSRYAKTEEKFSRHNLNLTDSHSVSQDIRVRGERGLEEGDIENQNRLG
ncbi:Protein of unknown function [Gryllus bimaculatus]|nr:Protein of unknown function [Gryllus bimaculatus]